MRVFLDTNVLVAAYATHGLCEDVFRVLLAEHELVVSETVLAEFERVLGQKLRLPLPQVKTLSSFPRRQADIVDPVAPRSAEGGWKIFLQFSQTDQSGGSRV